VIEAFTVKEKTNEYFQELSKREQEILEQLSKGYRYKEIADQLFLSIETVRTHIRNIYEKLQVNSRVEALKKTGLL
jgi:DNA-binding NarL/FixJ family response regulator